MNTPLEITAKNKTYKLAPTLIGLAVIVGFIYGIVSNTVWMIVVSGLFILPVVLLILFLLTLLIVNVIDLKRNPEDWTNAGLVVKDDKIQQLYTKRYKRRLKTMHMNPSLAKLFKL